MNKLLEIYVDANCNYYMVGQKIISDKGIKMGYRAHRVTVAGKELHYEEPIKLLPWRTDLKAALRDLSEHAARRGWTEI